ncbi:MAG: CoB--CoM heterodisulfide reductase iron-sulfur subunit A family protein [Bacteroidales bacterium]|nr:CoB--CoM heterodisulfide reductase iron-sulfur subunit A family protein [Bacteroidales bacterium]
MKENIITGIYFFNQPNGYKDPVNFNEVVGYARNIPGLKLIGANVNAPPVDRKQFKSIITAENISRIVLAGYHCGTVKPFFARIFADLGIDTSNIIVCDFAEFGAVNSTDTELAKALLFCTVKDIAPESAIPSEFGDVNPETLVIGGGIAGIQASLEIANSNHKVYLLERTGTIGGHMAMFDKTFPTLDCAACILTPKMVEVGQHPNIEMLTYSEVIDISGEAGNYKVKILKKARRVDLSTCIGCGICSEKCPSKTVSEFDAGTTLRKAIYIPFPQAVPNKYVIDAEHCIYVQKGKCGVCVKVCLTKCIDLDEKDEEVELTVGNIVLATGFKTFDASRSENFGYKKFPNVLTSLEFERLVNAAGPTGGKITYRSEDKKGNSVFVKESEEPESIAIIHCVGSRDVNHNKYCSRVCCMYSLKLAHLVTEKIPDAKVYEYFIDMRAFGKGYEEFYERIKEEGVHIIRGRTAKVEQKNGKLQLRSEDILNDRLIEQEVDMVVLSVGLEPREETADLAHMTGIKTDQDGWFSEANYNTDPTNTIKSGISVAGVCQGPKDIPDTVAQASAAASRVIQSIINGKIKKSTKVTDIKAIEEKVNQLTTLTKD